MHTRPSSFWRWRQENQEFNFTYRVSSRPAWATRDLVSNKQTQQITLKQSKTKPKTKKLLFPASQTLFSLIVALLTVVLNPWVVTIPTLLRISDIYITIHNSSKITVMKSEY